MGSFSTCGGLPDESCGDNEVFLPGDEEKHAFEKECEATDALVQIGGMLLDTVQILRDSHKMRCQQLYGPTEHSFRLGLNRLLNTNSLFEFTLPPPCRSAC